MAREDLVKMLTGEALGIPPERLDMQGWVAASHHYKKATRGAKFEMELGLAEQIARSDDWGFVTNAIDLARALRLGSANMHDAVADTSGRAKKAPEHFRDVIATEVRRYGRDVPKKRIELSRANLRRAHLAGANLTEVNLTGANLTEAILTGAILTFTNLPRAHLAEANLSGADLRGANLSGANLAGADLSGADLRGANLRGADLGGADLRGATLDGTLLTETQLDRAILTGEDLTDSGLAEAN